jgi:hypothetical protein
MTRALVERVADALLYEGYLLYPYRTSSVKNRKRWTFGVLHPPVWTAASGGADPSEMQTECLVEGSPTTVVSVRLRFLQLVPTASSVRSDAAVALAAPEAAVPRELAAPGLELGALAAGPRELSFRVGADEAATQALDVALELAAEPLTSGAYRLRVRVANRTLELLSPPSGREAALRRSLVSTHTIVQVARGELVSLLDPPEALRAAAEACRNVGTWPVLVGEPGSRDAMLSSPIIVYDYPRIAPESPGDLFDATEIDEILSLRILTLTDEEKHAMRSTDGLARALLERTEALGAEDLLRLHGTLRAPEGATPALRAGARVRLRPRARADIFDVALAGRTATVVSVEEDLEGKLHVAVTVDDDPGRDLGAAGQVGHRFFFAPDEVELLDGPGRGAA